MDSNAIQICVRVRPWHAEKELPYITQKSNEVVFLGDGNFAVSPRKPVPIGSLREVVDVVDDRALHFDTPEPNAETKRGQPGAKRYKDRRYIFDQVFPMDATQEMVFERTAKPLLDGVLDGYNATVFAYGATGCGKTHTISGNEADPGITIRIMRELFEKIEESKDEYDTYIELSMVEIYNELIRDLLSDNFPSFPPGGLKLLENEKERVTLDRVTLKRPQSVEEVMEMVLLGNQRRSTSFTASNSESSRSHAVLQISVGRNSKGHTVDLASAVVKQCTSSATLSIIDLAGSERAAATRNMGARMKEGANINKSLLALSSCISALCTRPVRGVSQHVPYRNSKLTRMLKFSLGGNCRTVMIVCVSPSSKDIEDTHNTLVWADKAKNVSTKITRNTGGFEVNVGQYLKTIQSLTTRNQELEKKLLADVKVEIQKAEQKRKAVMAEADTALKALRTDVDPLVALMLEGATQRSLWDGAELRMSSLKRRLDEVDNDVLGRTMEERRAEKAFLEDLFHQQRDAYRGNADVQAVIQQESSKKVAVETRFAALEKRKFNDALTELDLEYVHQCINIQRLEVAAKIAAAREKGYRESVQRQADLFAKAAGMLFRFTSTLQAETDSLVGALPNLGESEDAQSSIESLQQLSSHSEAALQSLFGGSLSPVAAPLPPVSHLDSDPPAKSSPAALPRRRPHPSPGDSSLSQSTRPSSYRLAAPRRPSAHPGDSSVSQPALAVRQSPAMRRLQATTRAPASPRRGGRFASPRKPVPRSTIVSKPSAVKKGGIRWRDEEGEGDLATRKSLTPSASGGDTTQSPETGEDAWEEVESDKSDSDMMRPPPIPTAGDSTNSASSSSTSAPRIAPPIPEWKKNRMLLGKLGGLQSLDEEPENQSSPENVPATRSFGLMGPPVRGARGPLTERHHVPAAATGSASSTPKSNTSSLYKPTLTSAARTSTSGPYGSHGASRRVSSIGPARNERRHSRMSAAPYSSVGESSMSMSMSMANKSISGLPSSGTNTSALSIGAKRLMEPTASSLNRRASVMGLNAPAGSSMAPRVSLASRPSMGNLAGTSAASGSGLRGPSLGGAPTGLGPGLPSLTSRPSISRFGMLSQIGIAGAGDTSKAAWR
ncbi:kinesin motor domain-domain-containing protein [Naematelia encephala]|uniref:Kinesin motor domain-domain-containing protein n=1 Tax=Naematelia encephala TaxID=71784 RepID=A0A1Y2BGV8_9TREE|nr:kinesin motor domain-domain-containing protein [Naematelia encephala]